MERLSGGGRQSYVDLRGFRAGPWSGILDAESDACRCHLEIRICVGGVGEPEAERKERRLALRFVPLIADLQPLVIGDVEFTAIDLEAGQEIDHIARTRGWLLRQLRARQI